jgi:7,8-dihydroneopterin aldolase/epimerase/oxygenase
LASIFIENLVVPAVIGIYEHEKLAPQPLRIDVEMGLSNEEAMMSDRIRDTVDYAAVALFITKEMETHRFGLLERAAGYLAPRLCKKFSSPWVRLKIGKPNVVAGAALVGVVYEFKV